PSLRFKPFDPTTFISPVVNRTLFVLSGLLCIWIFWACIGTERFLAKPFWEKTITSILIACFLALPSAFLSYQGSIPLLKRALRWKQTSRSNSSRHTQSEALF
ncbi:MAG TPA: hypothetical protein VHQ67_04145, partial [Nitrospiraceae bacterium]|nr:hypothetical protein [Nitrospiraceae bacterium]